MAAFYFCEWTCGPTLDVPIDFDRCETLDLARGAVRSRRDELGQAGYQFHGEIDALHCYPPEGSDLRKRILTVTEGSPWS